MVTEADKEAAANQKSDIDDALINQAIDAPYLAKKAKRELNAKETKLIKVKGAITQDQLPKGFKVIATSGLLSHGEDGEQVFGDGETVIRYDPAAMGIRQRGRQDVHKLRGDYPAEKVDHKFSDLPTMTVVVREAMKEENGSD